MRVSSLNKSILCLGLALFGLVARGQAEVGVGAKPLPGAEVVLDGSLAMLNEKWTYWEGPGFASRLPIQWKVVDDPVDKGTVIRTADPAAAGGKFGAADIVTKKAYRDFRVHVEFLINNPAETVASICRIDMKSRCWMVIRPTTGWRPSSMKPPRLTNFITASESGMPTTLHFELHDSRMANVPSNLW